MATITGKIGAVMVPGYNVAEKAGVWELAQVPLTFMRPGVQLRYHDWKHQGSDINGKGIFVETKKTKK